MNASDINKLRPAFRREKLKPIARRSLVGKYEDEIEKHYWQAFIDSHGKYCFNLFL